METLDTVNGHRRFRKLAAFHAGGALLWWTVSALPLAAKEQAPQP
jgi:hypothetical protein